MQIETVAQSEKWLKTIFNINRELDFERENLKVSIERIEHLERKKEEICGIIRQIKNPTYKMILHKRYVQGEKWEKIGEELNYGCQHIHRLHKAAVVEVHNIKTGRGN